MGRGSAIAAVALCAAVLCAAGCQPSDPEAKILKQRARWDVQLLSWVQTADGSIQMSTRLTGPPSSSIETLTVRIDLLDASGQTIDEVWHVFDLKPIARGGPLDVMVLLPAEGLQVEGIAIHRVLEPGPDERQHIPEIQI
jgi:hypothetical protein